MRLFGQSEDHIQAGRLARLALASSLMKEENGYAEVVRTEEGFEKCFRADFSDPGRLLAPIAEAAADLFCYGALAYLKKCEGQIVYCAFMTRRRITAAGGAVCPPAEIGRRRRLFIQGGARNRSVNDWPDREFLQCFTG